MRTPRRPKHVKPDLFTPLPQRPTWTALPPEIQARTLALLARLLRAAHDRRPVTATDKEVGRE